MQKPLPRERVEEAITQWEKGIESDPGYSSNYYNATMFHARKGNWLRAALYGELFLNPRKLFYPYRRDQRAVIYQLEQSTGTRKNTAVTRTENKHGF